MKYIFIMLLFILLNFSLTSCSKDSATETNNNQEGATALITERFNVFLHGNISTAQRDEIADSLNSNYSRIIADLRVTNMPKVRVDVWASDNSSDFYSVMRDRTGQVFTGATGYTPSATEMFVLYTDATPIVVVHEFAHLVSLKLNPGFGNNPRWLWEAVAQYESNSFTHPSTWNENDLNFPGFAELNQFSSPLPYTWGYFICKFIIEHWGHDKYVQSIQFNGHIQTVFGISETEFGAMLESYVRSLR